MLNMQHKFIIEVVLHQKLPTDAFNYRTSVLRVLQLRMNTLLQKAGYNCRRIMINQVDIINQTRDAFTATKSALDFP